MKALLVIDLQDGILKQKNFNSVIQNIEYLIKDFKKASCPVFFIQHLDEESESPLYKNKEGIQIYGDFNQFADCTIVKSTANAFFGTVLDSKLKESKVDHIYICGFNTEYCCMFTAIAGQDRGYKVTFMEDATGTVGDEDAYEMKGLDIQDFVGSVLNWSNLIEVLYLDGYINSA